MGRTGETPRALRGLRPGATMRRLARQTGLTMAHLSYVFSGKRRPSLRTAKRIAEALGVTLDALAAALDALCPAK